MIIIVSNLMPTLFKVSKMIKDNHNFDFFHHIIVTDGLISLYHLIRIWLDNLIVKEMDSGNCNPTLIASTLPLKLKLTACYALLLQTSNVVTYFKRDNGECNRTQCCSATTLSPIHKQSSLINTTSDP
ncbi:hypothetical protein DERP_014112 [Dermatophagoides pteronyssinus]|uniref:Uncharacterized protein n=1 Tax=Dermatophagoides pteronyssinus TaxID=6956 RepID=A0ABQ8IXC2_DERPT|nr:hypothetical protein DERP_014112 [Dermatophagoides pteronyssinus]